MALTRVLLVGTAMSALMVCATSFAQQPGSQQFQNPMQQNSNQQGEQQGRLSPREVRTYFRQVEGQINQAVQSGNARRLEQWTQNNIANGANFQAVIEIGGQNGPGRTPKEIRVLSLNKNDMLRRQQVAFSMAPQFLNMVENYDLGIRLVNVQPIGNDAAVVKTRISESGTIGGSGRQLGRSPGIGTQGMGSSEPQNQGQAQGPSRRPIRREPIPGAERIAGRGAEREPGSGSRNPRRWAGDGLQRQGGQGLSFDVSVECTQLVQREPNSGHLTIGCIGEMQF